MLILIGPEVGSSLVIILAICSFSCVRDSFRVSSPEVDEYFLWSPKQGTEQGSMLRMIDSEEFHCVNPLLNDLYGRYVLCICGGHDSACALHLPRITSKDVFSSTDK